MADNNDLRVALRELSELIPSLSTVEGKNMDNVKRLITEVQRFFETNDFQGKIAEELSFCVYMMHRDLEELLFDLSMPGQDARRIYFHYASAATGLLHYVNCIVHTLGETCQFVFVDPGNKKAICELARMYSVSVMQGYPDFDVKKSVTASALGLGLPDPYAKGGLLSNN